MRVSACVTVVSRSGVESGNILHTAALKIELNVGPSTFTMDPSGITLDAPTITLKAIGPITIKGLPVLIN